VVIAIHKDLLLINIRRQTTALDVPSRAKETDGPKGPTGMSQSPKIVVEGSIDVKFR